MYEAIQKLDEKFELLQARVTHIQEDQIHVEEDQSEVKPATEDNDAPSPVPPVELTIYISVVWTEIATMFYVFSLQTTKQQQKKFISLNLIAFVFNLVGAKLNRIRSVVN